MPADPSSDDQGDQTERTRISVSLSIAAAIALVFGVAAASHAGADARPGSTAIWADRNPS